jgi:transcriptional regulator with XRE-family HTH domain
VTSPILGSTIGAEVIVLKLNEKLKVLLSNQGWLQKRLAEMIYVSPDAVSSWVRGINQPDLDTIKKLCEIFYITSLFPSP